MHLVGGGQVRKGNERWNNKLMLVVKEKREVYEKNLQGRNGYEWEMFESIRRSRGRCRG